MSCKTRNQMIFWTLRELKGSNGPSVKQDEGVTDKDVFQQKKREEEGSTRLVLNP